MLFRSLSILLLAVSLLNACSDSKNYQIGIVKPLMVLNVTPGGANDVPLDSEVTVQFSDPVVEGSLTPKTVLLVGPDATAVEAAFTYVGTENKLTLKPAKPFAYSADYTITFNKKIKRRADRAVLAKEVVHTFRTIDPPNLTVVESAPSGNATSIGAFVDQAGAVTPYGDRVSTTIVVHFSEGIDSKSLTTSTFLLQDDAGVTVAGAFSWESTDEKIVDLLGNKIGTDNILTFTPTLPLKLSTKYTVTLKGTFKGIRSKRATESGGWFSEDIVWTFRTIDPPPLRILSSTPSDDANDVGILSNGAGGTDPYGAFVSQAVTIRFSEGVDTASVVTALTVFTKDTAVPVTGSVVFTSSGPAFWQLNDTMVFTPAVWDVSRNYDVNLAASAKSFRATAVSGDMGQPYSISFDTVDPLHLALNAFTPGDGAGVSATYISNGGAGNVVETEPGLFAMTFQFSEDVSVATADANSFASNLSITDELGAPLIPVSIAFAAGGRTVTVKVAAPGLSKQISININGGSVLAPYTGMASVRGVGIRSWYSNIDDAAGFLADFNATFFTPDPPALLLTSISPAAATSGYSDNVSRSSVFVLTFSEAVSATVIAAPGSYVTVTTGASMPVPATYAVDGSGTKLTITPNQPLLYSSLHQIHILGGANTIKSWRNTGVPGSLTPATATYQFKTEDPLTLSIWATSPSDQEDAFGISVTDVAVDSNLQILFDQAIDHASFASAISIVRCGPSALGCVTGSQIVPASISYTLFGGGAEKAIISMPPGSLSFDTFFQITIGGGVSGVRSVLNTGLCAVACEGGYMPADYTITFGTRSIPPLKVAVLSPVDGASGVEVRPDIVVQFASDVSLPTLTQYTFFVTDVTNNQLVKRFDGVSFYAGTNTAAIVLTSDLANDTEYNIVLVSSIQGVDSRYLGRDVRFSFHTKQASLVLKTDPGNTETDVELNLAQRDVAGLISVYFDGAVTASVNINQAMSVTYETARGTVLLRGYVSAVTTTGTVWTFDPADFCTPGNDPLEDNAIYYINITADVWRADGSAQLTGGLQAHFTTAGYTLIAGVSASNAVTGRPDLTIDMDADTDSVGGNGKDDVPVTSRFTIDFAEFMNTATIVYSATANSTADTLLVRKQNGTYVNLVNVTLTSSSVSFNVDDTAVNLVTNDLAFATNYTIILKEVVRDLVGNPLAGDYTLTFTTSAAPTATLVPLIDDVTRFRNATLGVVFSTAVAPESLTDANFYVGESVSGCPAGPFVAMPALIDIGYDSHSAAVILSPMMAASVCHNLVLSAGVTGPRDNRGNPFPGPAGNGTAYTRRVDSTPSDNGSTVIAATGFSPVAGANNVTGRQSVRVVLTPSNTNGDVLITSINPGTFMVYSDAGRTVEVPGRVYFDPALPGAVFDIANGSYFSAAQIYYVKLSRNISSTTRNNCDATCANYQFTIESIAPTTIVGPYATQQAMGPISVSFNEAMRPSTIINAVANLGVFSSTTTFDGTTLVPGAWTLAANGLSASFVPTLPLTGGNTYTVRVNTGARDLAGNSIAAVVGNTFVVESVAPTVTLVGAFTGADQTLDITYTENVAIGTILTSLLGATEILPGNLRIVTTVSGVDPLNPLDVANKAAEVFACAVVNGNVVTLDPIDLLPAATSYELGITGAVTDLGGTPLAPFVFTRVTP